MKPIQHDKREVEKLKQKINGFLINHKTILEDVAKRASQIFEAYSINNVLKYYEKRNWFVKVENLTAKNEFRYKFSTAGFLPNYSYFSIEKNEEILEIRHNLQVRTSSSFDYKYTVDVVVIRSGSIKKNSSSNKINKNDMYYVEASDVITFMEVKMNTPHPTLCAGFLGLVHEIKPELVGFVNVLKNSGKHLAPSLIASAKSTVFIDNLCRDFRNKKYCLNIISNAWLKPSGVYSNGLLLKLK